LKSLNPYLVVNLVGVEEKGFQVDSSDMELEEEKLLVHYRMKWRKGSGLEKSPTKIDGG